MDKVSLAVKTNYFRVWDEIAFAEYMDRAVVDGGKIELNMKMDSDGFPLVGFQTSGLIIGVPSESEEYEDADDDQYNNFLTGLQELVVDGDAIILLEVGASPDDISATATIITADEIDYVDLKDAAGDKALALLKGI